MLPFRFFKERTSSVSLLSLCVTFRLVSTVATTSRPHSAAVVAAVAAASFVSKPPTMVQTRRAAHLASAVKDNHDDDKIRALTRAKNTVTKAAFTTPKKSKSMPANDDDNDDKTNKKSPRKKSPVKSPKPPLPRSKMMGERRLLFSLRDDDELLEATLVGRPSKRNKSPYVGDIRFDSTDNDDDNDISKAPVYPLVHVPNLDMGGKCRPGVRLLVKPSRDRKGEKIHADATGKYGTPKCQYSCQVLWVDESTDGQQVLLPNEKSKDDGKDDPTDTVVSASSRTLYPPVWVGAHPSLGERIAEV
eukprot:scaffold39887_cov229-Amphora_coffeaeformis.AAC.8